MAHLSNKLLDNCRPVTESHLSRGVGREPAGARRIVLYSREDGALAIEVHLDADTVWLTRQQLAELFQTSRTNVVEHIQHIYEEGELAQAHPAKMM
jgi:hypothetical protein